MKKRFVNNNSLFISILLAILCLTLLILNDKKASGKKNIPPFTSFKIDQTLKKEYKAPKIVLNNTTNDDISLSYFDYFSDLVPIKIHPHQSFIINTEIPLWVINTHYKHGTVYLLNPGDSLDASFDIGNDIKLTAPGNKERGKEIDIFRFVNSKFEKSYYQIIFDNSDSPSLVDEKFIKRSKLLKRQFTNGMQLVEQYIAENKLGPEFSRCAKNIFKLEYYSKALLGLWNSKSLQNVVYEHKDVFDSAYLDLLRDSLDYTCSPISYRNIKYSYFIRSVQFKINQDPFEKTEYQRPLADTSYKFALNEIKNQERLDNFLFLIVKEELLKYPRSSQECLQLFLKDCKNDDYKKYISEMVAISKDSANSDDVVLNFFKEQSGFSKVINSFKGKVVYMDVWASWCAPCRSEFPAAFKLRQKYAGRPVQFFYVSIDNNYNLWSKAIKQEGLADFPSSYLLLDFENSNFKRAFRIGPIPRYLIFDKSGNVVNANAPKPSDSLIYKILDNLAK